MNTSDNQEPSREDLIHALSEACDVATWMSGSPSFSPGGEAHEGWVKARERLFVALKVLQNSLDPLAQHVSITPAGERSTVNGEDDPANELKPWDMGY